ncbi:MAG: 4-alpha-glucanotransferase [Pseudomonadota bacterium]|nr:4-alpha-glucanotransferase [Pseudomonadota bacterium]
MEAETDRQAGVLLHVTSLPSARGSGRLGRDARRFVDWLAEAGFSVWQVLPLTPTHDDLSPYLGFSSFAGNPNLIDAPSLQQDSALRESWLGQGLREADGIDGPGLVRRLQGLVKEHEPESLPGGTAFQHDNRGWLPDYACFMTLRHDQGGRAWLEWDAPLRDRNEAAVAAVVEREVDLYRAYLLEQYLFERQWRALKSYANRSGVSIFGDAPLYVAHDSADVWANRQFFALDDEGRPTQVAGTPPDMFSETGQIWGNPVYDWEALARDGFRWWISRIERQLGLYDLLRIDHFRGLQAYWSIPAGEETAVGGEWVEAPGDSLLQALRDRLGRLPLVAEDLGYITAEVDRLRERFGLPSMRVLQFAFDGSEDNPHLPRNTPVNAVAYTGTHDNDTVVGWYASLHPEAQAYVRATLGIGSRDTVLETMIDGVLESPAQLAMLPMQDILGLGSEGRMNTPATIEGNWRWQFRWRQLEDAVATDYRRRLRHAGRVISNRNR